MAKRHGGHGTLTYSRWQSMMQRCCDPNHRSYPRYGGANITVCEVWRSFPQFLADMGECPDRSLTLDRIEGSLGYHPGNCRWATRVEQNRNRPSHNVSLTYLGVTKTATDWAAEIGISADTLLHRVRLGWSHERALTAPLKPRGIRASRKAA